MSSSKPDPRFRHGRSEAKSRPAVTRALVREQRQVGERLRAIRKERGISQEEAAESIGIHAKHLQRLEAGHPKTNVSMRTLVALALAYKISVRDLFDDQPDGPRTKAR